MSQRREAEIVIIGAGIWGLSAAYHLGCLGRGSDVLVIERHATILDEVSRYAVGPIRLLHDASVLVRGASYTLGLFSQFRQNTKQDPQFHPSGGLYVASTDEQRDRLLSFQATADALQLDYERISVSRARKLAPGFGFNESQWIYWIPSEGYVQLRSAGAALAAAALELGVRFATDVEAESMLLEDGRIRAVKTTKRTVETSKVIITAGFVSSLLVQSIGARLPLRSLPLLSIQTSPSGIQSNHPLVHLLDVNATVREEQGGYLCNTLGGTAEETGETIEERVANVRSCMADRALDQIAVQQQMPTTSAPRELLIGPIAQAHGLWIASGGGCSCASFAGAVGRWLAKSTVNGHPGDDLSAYRLLAEPTVPV